ncbi:hypothetical protein LAZ40_09960 [Cereibacter sphaeroides]|nr:hypothetical protein [Cereibacter sphaeroides]MCE6972968.1 hypothetical protein [Cereibacter sphaeroides]
MTPAAAPCGAPQDPAGLRLYAVLRGDVQMSEGKSNAQAGHAYCDALLHSLSHPDPDIRTSAASYAALKPGTKICLDGGSIDAMHRLMDDLAAAGIPFIQITDQDHVELPDFDGSPILTAIGIGPHHVKDQPRFLRRLARWTGGKRGRLARKEAAVA